MVRIKVRPQKKDLTVLDVNGNKIPYKIKGHGVPSTAFYRRLIRDGDLVKIGKSTNTPAGGE